MSRKNVPGRYLLGTLKDKASYAGITQIRFQNLSSQHETPPERIFFRLAGVI